MKRNRLIQILREYWQTILFAAVLLLLLMKLSFHIGSLRVYAVQTAALFPAVLGGAVIFLSGSYDLSSGAETAFGTVLISLFIICFHLPVSVSFLLFVMYVLCYGFFKGCLVTTVNARYELLTLILQFLLIPCGNLLRMYISGMYRTEVSLARFSAFLYAGAIITALLIWIFLNRTTYGKSISILGRVIRISMHSGMNSKQLKQTAVMVSSLLIGITAVNMIIRTGVPTSLNGDNLNYQILAAVSLIAADSLNGRNAVIRSFMAAGIIVMITAILQLNGLDSLGVLALYGIMILFPFGIRAYAKTLR